jgi:hypothetical protein
VSNLDGERFNLIRAGAHELLRLPREVVPSGGHPLLLKVQGRVEQEQSCVDAYVKDVLITGEWLRESGSLSFRTGGNTSGSADAIQLKVNGSSVSVKELRDDSRLAHLIENVAAHGAPHGEPKVEKIRRLNFLTVKLRFPLATLTVDWLHRQTPGFSVNHLNFQASGLPRPQVMDVGGILGRDSHALAVTPSEECRQDWDLMGLHSKELSASQEADWLSASYVATGEGN